MPNFMPRPYLSLAVCAALSILADYRQECITICFQLFGPHASNFCQRGK
jgi:hypothetical protein